MKDNTQVRKFVRDALIKESLLLESRASDNYEQQVIDALEAEKICGNIKKAVGSNSANVDAEIKLPGFTQPINIEIKMNSEAYMGGSSMHAKIISGSVVYSSGGKNDETKDFIKDFSNSFAPVNDKVIKIVNTLNDLESKRDLNKKYEGFPLSGFHKDDWEIMKKEMKDHGTLTFKIAVSGEEARDFIQKHYKNKNVFYIQIGGKGLFCLGKENPIGLNSIPILQCDNNSEIEIRAARGGGTTSAKVPDNGIRNATLRVQAKIAMNVTSPYNLDTPKGAEAFLQAYNNFQKQKTKPQTASIASESSQRIRSTENLLSLLFA
jgi:mRNA-degrading endonuclease YafQ of YafQ-DinJ toxin-antitoxin module